VNLRKALKTWLNTMSKELLIRIRLTCGHFPIWSELLEQPLNRVRRFHNIKTISLSIRSPVHPPSLPISPSWPVSPPEICHSSSSNPSFMSTAFTTPEQDISDFEPSRQGPALGHGGPPYSLPEIEQILPNFPQRALSSKAPTRVPPGGWNPELLCDNLAESEDSNNISVGGFDDGLSAYMDWEDVFQIESQQTISGVQSPKISSDAEEAPFHVPACLPSGIQADTSGTMAFGRASTQYGYWDSDMLSHLT
jgi:hypothetical protein